MSLFNFKPIEGKTLQNIKKVVREKLGEEVIRGYKIFAGKKFKTCKLDIRKGASLRMDTKYNREITRRQIVANQNNIEVPKVILNEGKYKFSEWIEGVILYDVWNIAEVFIKSGDLVGRLNLVKDPKTGQFLTNAEFSSTNAVWTPDKKVYIIDHGRMKTSTNPDGSVVQILLKRIREKERINLFLNAYSKYRKIDNIMKLIEKRNWNWDARKTLRKSEHNLKY